MEKHRFKVEYYGKVRKCIDDEGSPRVVKGLPKKVSVRKMSSFRLGKFYKNSCQLYLVHTSDFLEDEGSIIEDYQLLQEFKDVFPDEVPGMPPKRDWFHNKYSSRGNTDF